jgi:capsular exopolysaccharide synthesis family protein
MTGSLVPGKSKPVTSGNAEVMTPFTPGANALTAAGATPPAEPGMNQVARIISALRRFAWLIVLVTVIGVAGSVLATQLMKPEYVVPATIYIEVRDNKSAGPIQAPELLSAYNWVELLNTFAVLDPVVNERKLYLRPGKGAAPSLLEEFSLADRFLPGDYILTVDAAGQKFTLKNKAGQTLSAGAVTDSVGQSSGFRWQPGPRRLTAGLKAAFTVLTPRDASADLSRRLSTKMSDTDGNFLRMYLTGTDPVATAATMNALQSQFVSVAADLKKEKLRQLTTLLGEQLKQQEVKLRQSEQALEGFRIATITQPRDEVPVAPGLSMTSSSTYGRYFQQRIDLEAIRHDRENIEAVMVRLAAGETTVDAFNTIPAVRGAPDFGKVLNELSTAEADLRGLKTKYTDEFRGVRDLQDKINTIRSVTVPQYAEALVRQLKIQESDLQGRIGTVSAELKGIPTRTITEGRLQRDVESARVLFVTLQDRYEQAKLAEISAIPDVRILDRAVAPTRPQKNQGSRIIIIGIAASLATGLGLALLLDRLDKRFRYPEQASHDMGLTILGAIPVLPRTRSGRQIPAEETAQVVEAFRAIRLNLAHSFEATGPICLTISSPSPGDGKSLIAANLALSFAEAGYRTLLLDGDIRRGELHRTFGSDRRPGLLDYLGGGPGITVERILRPTSHANLTLIPCGTRVQHGPELLGSARMAELVSLLKGRYEAILIDSPPLGSGIDPFVLGTHSANMMIVLRSGETDRQMAEVKLRILDRLPVRLLGAVLNHISAGVGAYKYYSYSYGYSAEDEMATTDQKSLSESVPSTGK